MPERSFLDALKADPNDEVTRLVYADWLEEQGDFRGELLRAEMAYFRGEASLLQVSSLVARAAPAWLCEAALIARQVEALWARAGKAFGLVDGSGARSWQEAEGAIKAVFAKAAPARGGDFLVPYDYALFQHLFPGGWYREGGRGVECAIWGAEMVAGRTEFWYEDVLGAGAAEFWLSIGTPWSDHEEHFLCCDRASGRFGEAVAAGDDFHPAAAPGTRLERLGGSFLEYLRRLAL